MIFLYYTKSKGVVHCIIGLGGQNPVFRDELQANDGVTSKLPISHQIKDCEHFPPCPILASPISVKVRLELVLIRDELSYNGGITSQLPMSHKTKRGSPVDNRPSTDYLHNFVYLFIFVYTYIYIYIFSFH